MSGHPITLKTPFGITQFEILSKQRSAYAQVGAIAAFQEQCQEDFATMNHYMKYFLEDPTMMSTYKFDEFDEATWKMYKEMGDMVSCLRYFSGKEFWISH